MQRVIYYHKGCPDGFGAAWSAWKKLGYSAEYIPMKHGDEIPEYRGCQVYFLDICPTKEVLDRLEESNRVVILDHHKSAKDIVESCKEGVFDLHRSGAGIAWDYFCGNKKRPKMIDIIEDRDLWNWKVSGSREVLMVLDSTQKTFETWDEFAKEIECEEDKESWGYENAKKVGSVIVEYQMSLVRRACSGSYIGSVNGHPATIVNSSVLQSFIGNTILNSSDADLVAIYYEKNGVFSFSLRSNDNVDCSEISAYYGGGGHFNAAGFVANSLEEVLGEDRF